MKLKISSSPFIIILYGVSPPYSSEKNRVLVVLITKWISDSLLFKYLKEGSDSNTVGFNKSKNTK